MKSQMCIVAVVVFSLSNTVASNFIQSRLDDKANKIDSLYDMAWDYLYKNPDSTIIIAKYQIDFSKKHEEILGQINGYYITGYAYYLKDYFDIAAQFYYKGLDLIGTNTDPNLKDRRMVLLQNIGITYELTFNYDLALKYFEDAKKIAEELELNNDLEVLTYNLGVIYRKKGLYEEAKSYFNTALKINNHTKDFRNQSRIYNALGHLCHLQKDYQSANDLYLKAFDISSKDQNSEPDRARYITNIGENYYFQNQFELAKKYYHQALEVSEKFNDIEKIKWIYNNIGDVYLKEKNFTEAMNYYHKTIALGDINALDDELQQAFKNISEAYTALGEYKLALEYNSKYIAQTDKIVASKEDLSQQNAQYRMREIDWQREMMQKEVMLASAEKENHWGRIIIGVAFLMIIICARFIYVYYSKISQARKIVNSYSIDSFDF